MGKGPDGASALQGAPGGELGSNQLTGASLAAPQGATSGHTVPPASFIGKSRISANLECREAPDA